MPRQGTALGTSFNNSISNQMAPAFNAKRSPASGWRCHYPRADRGRRNNRCCPCLVPV